MTSVALRNLEELKLTTSSSPLKDTWKRVMRYCRFVFYITHLSCASLFLPSLIFTRWLMHILKHPEECGCLCVCEKARFYDLVIVLFSSSNHLLWKKEMKVTTPHPHCKTESMSWFLSFLEMVTCYWVKICKPRWDMFEKSPVTWVMWSVIFISDFIFAIENLIAHDLSNDTGLL